MIRTNEAAIKYQKLYQTQKEKREQYEKKDYDRRMTPRDKKKAESRFAFRGNKLQIKHIMLIFIMVIVLLLFLDSSYPFHSYFGTGAYILIFFLLYIAFFYNVKKKILSNNYYFIPDNF